MFKKFIPLFQKRKSARRSGVVGLGKGISKRRRFVLVSITLGILLLAVQRVSPDKRLPGFLVMFFVAYGLSAWSLMKDLDGVEWIMNVILPAMFPVAVGLFYFLLPQRVMVQTLVVTIFMLGMYALLLTENIFSVASIRTIQLLRAARAVGFLLTIMTGAFLFHLVLSFRFGPGWNFLLVALVSFPLFLQGLWSSVLESTQSYRVVQFSLISSLAVGELALVLSFWPVEVAMGSIFLAMVMYVILGIFQHFLEQRLFRKTLQEYLGFGVIVFVIVLASVTMRWGQ